MKRAVTVVPRAAMVLFQKPAAQIFTSKDQAHVSQSSEPNRTFFYKTADGSQKSGAAVDREHPEGSMSCQFLVFAGQCDQSGEAYLHTPAGEAAAEKVRNEVFAEIVHEQWSFLNHVGKCVLTGESTLFYP